MQTMIYVEVPGKVNQTSQGKVRQTTQRRLVRAARALRPDLAEYAVVEMWYPTSNNNRNSTRLSFDTSRPALYGFQG
jgi:hypothetical protein